MTNHKTLASWLEAMPTRRFAFISLALLLLAVCGHYLRAEYKAIGGFGMGLDDSWIHAVMARNLAEGHGFSFNPGEPVTATTAPLYTALLAAWYFFFREVLFGAKLIGVVSLGLIAYFLYRSAEAMSGNRLAAWMAAALALTSTSLLVAGLSGMETALYLVSPCLALFLWTKQRYTGMIAALALAVWLRPEALLLLGLGILAAPRARWPRLMAVTALILLPYFALNYSLGGHLFPATVQTKAAVYEGHFQSAIWREAWTLFGRLNSPWLLLALPFGAIFLWRKAWWAALFPFAFFLVVWASLHTMSALCRYGYPLLPFYFLMAGLAFAWFSNRLPVPRSVVVVAALVLLAVQAVAGYRGANYHGGAVENIAHMQRDIALAVSQITAPSDTVATNDIGAMGWFSGCYVRDTAGLIHPLKSLDQILSEHHPPLLVIFDSWYPGRLQSAVFQNEYQYFVHVELTWNVVCGSPRMSLYARRDRIEEYSNRLSEIGR